MRNNAQLSVDLVVTTRCRLGKERFAMSLWNMREVTRITGATESALRYYNAKGVLSPTVREETVRRPKTAQILRDLRRRSPKAAKCWRKKKKKSSK